MLQLGELLPCWDGCGGGEGGAVGAVVPSGLQILLAALLEGCLPRVPEGGSHPRAPGGLTLFRMAMGEYDRFLLLYKRHKCEEEKNSSFRIHAFEQIKFLLLYLSIFMSTEKSNTSSQPLVIG